MARDPADPRILSVNISEPNSNGVADIGIEVENQSQTTAPGEDFDIMYAHVDAPHMNQAPIWWCGIIGPGGTIIVDDSSGNAPGLEGEIDVPAEGGVDITVEVGGIDRSNFTDCANVLNQGSQPTDTQTVRVGESSGGGGGGISTRTLALAGVGLVGAYYVTQRR